MSEIFRCDDKETLVAYLYGEIDAELRREVERHLRTCGACARESEELHAVRQDLALWLPPEPELGFTLVQKSAQPQPTASVLRPSRWVAMNGLPAWAKTAAAVLVMGAGLALANLQVRYDNAGLVVTSGWMSPAPSPPVEAPQAPADEWRPALVALEQSFRSELGQMKRTSEQASAAVRTPETPPDMSAVLRRVQSMIDASEHRQRQEMAVRLTQATRDWSIQRQGDLLRINQDLGTLQGRAFRTEAGQREVVNYVNYLRRVSGQPIP